MSDHACRTFAHLNRRTLLKAAGMSGVAWLTPVATALAEEDTVKTRGGRPAQSVIFLWLGGGPSQLETFDPHAGKLIGGDTKAIKTSAPGVMIGSGLAQLAERMSDIALVRNVVSREGDHERAAYNVKTGFRPDPTLSHPALGAVVCHQLPVGQAEIPRHVSILPDMWHARGGYLGPEFDAFRMTTVGEAPNNVKPRTSQPRFDQRMKDLAFVEQQFRAGSTVHDRAVAMMTTDQLKAFDLALETTDTRQEFGRTPFGDACLTALRLIDEGVRCVEVTLDGWDTHFNNHDLQHGLVERLDPAFAALIKHLKLRDRWKDTIIVCGGEFGRTPIVNPAAGRDHWPHGFSIALAGGPIRGGHVIGETDPEGGRVEYEQGTPIENVHATVLSALGIKPWLELDTPVGRPIKLSEGTAIESLIS